MSLLINLNPISAFAQLLIGPVSSGVGGAGVASVEVVESSFFNPASLAHAPSFVGGVFYKDGWLDGVNHTSELAVNMVDNSEGVIIPGGFGFIQRRTNYLGLPSVDKKLWNLSFGNFFISKLAFGASFHYVESETSSESYDDFNLTAGIIWNPHPDWGFGLSCYNLLGGNEEIPLYFRELANLTAGFTFIASEFLRVRFDVAKLLEQNPDANLVLKGGIESFLSEYFILRLGWNSDQNSNQETLTAGFSFVGPRFTLDYAYQQKQQGIVNGPLHSVDLSFPF